MAATEVNGQFALTPEQRAIHEMAAAFARDAVAPHALAWDRDRHFPADTVRSCGALGLGGIYVGEDSGGAGLGRLDAVLVFEALAAACPAFAAFVSIHNMCASLIDRFGSPELRAAYLPGLIAMDSLASYCLTEPGSGSDAAALRTRAVRNGDRYTIEGTKQFISGAGVSDRYIVMARTGEEGPKGISAFVVEAGTPGLSFGPLEEKMGWHMQPTRQVVLQACSVPISNRLGAEGMGFRIAMAGLDGGRLNIAACSLGGAQLAFDKALAYAGERKAFGNELRSFQTIQFRLADMETELQAARALLYAAAARFDAGDADAAKWSAMAKRFVTDVGFRVANDALQLYGGYGYLHDYGIEKIVRDLRVHQILEGTNEIMRLIIARSLICR